MSLCENRFITEEELKNFLIDNIVKKVIEKENEAALIFITRKGYWTYKTLVDSEYQGKLNHSNDSKKSPKVVVYSDRYMLKCLDFNQFNGREIYIIDDTMNNGANLFFFYAFLKKREEIYDPRIHPIAYALNVNYPSETSKKILELEYNRVIRSELDTISEGDLAEKRKKIIEAFNKDLSCYTRLVPEDIARICVKETQMFQNRLCPLVVDLPILSVQKTESGDMLPYYMEKEQSGGLKGITMSMEQFDRLKKNGGSKWRYTENIFTFQNCEITCSYFTWVDEQLLELSRTAIHDYVVKCKYKIEDGLVKAVFVPFAIFNSMTFEDAVHYFFTLMGDTSYGDFVWEHIKTKANKLGESWESNDWKNETILQHPKFMEILEKDHNLCRNIYRSVIYFVSAVIKESFTNYVKSETGIELIQDWEFMYESNDYEFIKYFKDSDADEGDFLLKLMRLSDSDAVPAVDVEIPDNLQKQIASEEGIRTFILERLIQKKNDISENLRKHNYMIETLRDELKQAFFFENEDEKKDAITKAIVSMLEISAFGNAIYVSNQDHVIYRGFRHGENSELLFVPGMEYFFSYVYALYFLKPKEYTELYPVFSQWVEDVFRQEHYIGTLISEAAFYFLKRYFGNIQNEKQEEQIMNKQFVLDIYLNTNENMSFFIRQSFEHVKYWTDQEEGV